MTAKEFVSIDAKQIRASEELMQLFVNFYEAAFFIKPNCGGCIFNAGFKKLKKFHSINQKNNINFEVMKERTFKINRKYLSDILTYKKDGVTYRKYANKMTEEFAIQLIADGQTHIFDVLPKDAKEVSKTQEVAEVKEVTEVQGVDYYAMNYRKEVLPLYAKLSEQTGKKAVNNKKKSIIDFIKKNEN